MSTLYYALFYELAECCADAIAGSRSGPHSDKAWKQCFRALEHNYSKKQCGHVFKMRFPKELKDFANTYITMQLKRHRADYSPDERVTPYGVARAATQVERALAKFRSAPDLDKRAFCAFVLLKKRPD